MSSGRGYKVGMRGANKSAGRKDIRSRQKKKYQRGEKNAQHMMFEHQDAQSERNSMPALTILIRMKDEEQEENITQDMVDIRKQHISIMNDFKYLNNYLDENVTSDYEMTSWDEEDFMSNEEYNQMIDDAFAEAEKWADY